MEKRHLVYVPFTGLGLYKGYRGDKWLKERIKVFCNYVVPSLVNQSTTNFLLWISWRPEEEKNPIVQQFRDILSGIRGLDVVFTYGGVCFFDDKYGPQEGRERLIKSLTINLEQIKPYVEGSDWVYMTIQPSDDLYVADAMKVFQSVEPKEKEAVGFKNGYIINYTTKDIAEYNPNTIPPFYTIIFPTSTFLSPFAHMTYIGPYESHEYVANKFEFLPIEGRGFVVGTHGNNISTTWNHPFKGRILTNDERDSVLIRTGIYFSDTIAGKQSSRLLARKIINRLPFQNKLRNLYHRLPAVWKVF